VLGPIISDLLLAGVLYKGNSALCLRIRLDEHRRPWANFVLTPSDALGQLILCPHFVLTPSVTVLNMPLMHAWYICMCYSVGYSVRLIKEDNNHH
jgi:hypothetical protein